MTGCARLQASRRGRLRRERLHLRRPPPSGARARISGPAHALGLSPDALSPRGQAAVTDATMLSLAHAAQLLSMAPRASEQLRARSEARAPRAGRTARAFAARGREVNEDVVEAEGGVGPIEAVCHGVGHCGWLTFL